MAIIKNFYGKTKNYEDVFIFNLRNNNSMEANIINYGATLVSLFVPNGNNILEDVVLGYDSLAEYENGTKFFGATIGRCSNRIENSRFAINNTEYKLSKNDGENNLHGGNNGFHRVVWTVDNIDSLNNSLSLSYLSVDGEEGFPGNLKVTVTYTLTDDNSLKIDYYATSDKDTLVNLTNHSYFNLSGHSSGDILDKKLFINSSKFTINDKYSIPTGEIQKVSDTPMDFLCPKIIGQDIDNNYEQIKFGSGYDHNWILDTNGDLTKMCAKVIDEKSGRVMEVYTTKPAIQFYSGNFVDETDIGKTNVPYKKRAALCLETQYIPNAINNPSFPNPTLKAGDEYKHTTMYKFL